MSPSDQESRLKIVQAWGEYFFHVSSDSLDADLQFISERKLENLIINGRSAYELANIDWLAEVGSQVKKLVVTPPPRSSFDYNGFCNCPNLLYLKVNNEMKEKLVLKSLSNLEVLDLADAQQVEGIDQLTNLKSLVVTRLAKAQQSASLVQRLENLKVFSISSTDLSVGLEFMSGTNVEQLCIFSCRKASFLGIQSLPLKILWVDKTKNIENFDRIFDLDKLTELKLTDSEPLENADSLNRFSSLESLILLGSSVIQDGDLSPLKFRFRNFSFDDKKHYNIRYATFQDKYLK